MHDGISKTDEKDAHSIFDLLQQGKFFLPVERDPELRAAYCMMQRHMPMKKRVSRMRNQLRAAIHLAFPELNSLIKDLAQPTSLRFLQANPTPRSIARNGLRRFLEKWRPRRRCGQWRPEKFQQIYELARTTVGLRDPYRIDEFVIKALAYDLTDALEKEDMWLRKAIELLEHRPDYQVLLRLPRIGTPIAAAILTGIGDITKYRNGKQLVKLAGLDLKVFESGATIRKRPKISHVGSAYLRHWLYHYAKRLVAHDPHFIMKSEKGSEKGSVFDKSYATRCRFLNVFGRIFGLLSIQYFKRHVRHEATQKMRGGPSKSACRSRLQTTSSCCGQEPWW